MTRAVEHPVVAAFVQKMQTPEAKAIYRQRGGVAEFPNAWIKTKIGLRQFRLRGSLKVLMESMWACLTYNIQQWIRLRWRVQPLAATA
ncbi:MAG: transposase [Verrucomicrobiota bacterium]